jgi:hypothetical protein
MKKACIIAAILLVAGIALSIVALAIVGFDYRKLATVQFETNSYTAEGTFDSIVIEETTGNISFVLSEDGTFRVVCREPEKTAHTVEIADGTLKIVATKQKDWTGFLDLSFETPTVTVYLPADTYRSLTVQTRTGDLDIPEWMHLENIEIATDTGDVRCCASVSGKMKISTHTGNIALEDLTADTIECSTSTGDVKMQSVTCAGDVSVKVSTGDVSFANLIAKRILSESSTGDVRLDNSDAEEIVIHTSTGDVSGSLRSGKTFTAHTSTGDVSVPQNTDGGRCEITTSTGDISIRIVGGK